MQRLISPRSSIHIWSFLYSSYAKIAAYCSRKCQAFDWRRGTNGVCCTRAFSPHIFSCHLEHAKRAAIYGQGGFVPESHGMFDRSMTHIIDVSGRKVCTGHRLVRCPRCALDFAHFNAAVAAVATAGALYSMKGRSKKSAPPQSCSKTPQCINCGAVTAVMRLARPCALQQNSCWLCLEWCVCCGRLHASSLCSARVCRQCLLALICRRIRTAYAL